MKKNIQGQPIVPGRASGPLLISSEPLSFWGGYDQDSGEIIDQRHPLSGQNAANCVLALPYSRGSSTGTAVLLESVRNGTAPAAIITTGTDTFFALASIVAEEMYVASLPVIALTPSAFEKLEGAARVDIVQSGALRLHTS